MTNILIITRAPRERRARPDVAPDNNNDNDANNATTTNDY